MIHNNFQTHKLTYFPFPKDKEMKEYTVGEAFLKCKGISNLELSTLENHKPDPPDLTFKSIGYGYLGIEVTEFVPYDRKYLNRRSEFIMELKEKVNSLGVHPDKPSNIWILTNKFEFPIISQEDIVKISNNIDKFFKSENFTNSYEITHEIINEPIIVTFIPGMGNFSLPKDCVNNLNIECKFGFDIDFNVGENTIEQIINKKKGMEDKAEILVIYQGVLPYDDIFNDIKNQILDELHYKGIYLLKIMQTNQNDIYLIRPNTIKEHPYFLKGKDSNEK